MAEKKFSELSTASQVNDSDIFAISQSDEQGGFVSLKATILALANKIVTGINFSSALQTTNKTITGAINEIAQGGGGGGASTEIIADDFDATSTYAVGDYVVYNNKLYKCTTAVTTAGAWDSNDWTETIVMDEVGQGGGSSWTDVTGTLTAGATSITLSNSAITTSSTIDIYTDLDVDYNSISVSAGSVTVTFDAQQSNMGVKVRVS